MNTSSDIKIEKPNIIQALLSGFNTIASKPYLILLPIILDLFLWFGPGWRVIDVFRPFIQGMSDIPGLIGSEYADMVQSYQTLWQEILTNFNLATTLRTLPIGIPSLMVSETPFTNPMGHSLVFDLHTKLQVFSLLVLFLIIGYFLGNLYFQNISKEVVPANEKMTFKRSIKAFLQIVLMPVMLLIVLLILSIPILLLITVVTLISATLGEFVIFAVGVIILWILMPLIFTPHSIYLYKQNLIAAMMTSISVVRVSMGRTTWFILACFVLIRGLDLLWRSPEVDSWFLLIGILGHAFIVSAVIASSFHYFLDATKFTQTIMNRQQNTDPIPPFKINQ
jgi:hypothetical protein